jgi:hypothetical protein
MGGATAYPSHPKRHELCTKHSEVQQCRLGEATAFRCHPDYYQLRAEHS